MKSYKFRGGNETIFKRDLESLVNNLAWYSKLSELNDLLEGIIDDNYLRNQVSDLHKRFKARNPKLKDSDLQPLFISLDKFLNRRNKVGIYALSTTFKNEPLWAYYADDHKGFCIEYDFKILSAHTKQSEIHQTRVNYSVSRPKLEVSDLTKLSAGKIDPLIQKLLATKSRRWDNEEEIRLISDVSGTNYYDQNAVKAIYFGRKMESSRKDLVMSELKSRDIQFYQMEVDEESYGLKAYPVI